MVRKSQMPCRSGWPSAVRGTVQVAAATGTGTNAAKARTRGRTGIADLTNRRLMRTSCSFARLPAQMAVHQLFNELHALEFQDLSVLFQPTIERHADLPRLRKHLRVLDGGLIGESVRGERRVAFDDVQRVAMEVAGPVKPGPVV